MQNVSNTLLSPENYKVSRAVQRKRINNLDELKSSLLEVAPEFADYIIDGYKLIGKTNGFQQYIGEKDSQLFAVNISKIKGASQPSKQIEKDLSNMNLETTKLKNVVYDENLFVPLKSNTALDFVFSTEGGIMPATNYIVVGDPGIGKSSLTIQYVADILAQNPDKKILFISAEMTVMDMIPYTKRFPLWSELDIIFTSKLTEHTYKESVEAKLKQGYDLVLTDSFAELADAVRGDYNETVSGKDKKSYNDIEKWFVDQMVFQNEGNNELNLHTAFISIQQVNKSGDFVGSNKLKHNTTGMIELRYTKSGDRRIEVTKNRRGFEYQDLIFKFTEDVNEPIFYDVARIIRDKAIEKTIKESQQLQLDEEKDAAEWLKSLTGETELENN